MSAAAGGSLRSRIMASASSRLVLIALMLLLLMIPATMIRNVVLERDARRSEAVAGIVASWGGQQAVAGPILRLPFVRQVTVQDATGKNVEKREAEIAYFLPRRLAIVADLKTELRRRGIFEVPVYVAAVRLSGAFEQPDLGNWGVRPEDIDWPHAELLVSMTEPRSLRADAALAWNGRRIDLKPSTGQSGSWPTPGVHAALGLDTQGAIPLASTLFSNGNATFTLNLTINGAQQLSFAPTAEETTASLTSDWPHPSFQGQWLPTTRQITAGHSAAQWSVSYLGRHYPQRWLESRSTADAVAGASFGVDLDTPLDPYALADRSTKYALLTLVFTFAVIWLNEVLSGRPVHPIQYGFVGAALCLFGLLQLSFAEHFGFTAAFAVAAFAVLTLVTLYSHAVLKRWRPALAVGAVLAATYSYLLVILQAEDYALLGGSLALFTGIALAMFLTRRIDWFAAAGKDAVT